MDDGSRHKGWVRALRLVRLLNHCCHAAAMPPGISWVLVIQNHKQGCTLDVASCQPRLVGSLAVHNYTHQMAGGVI